MLGYTNDKHSTWRWKIGLLCFLLLAAGAFLVLFFGNNTVTQEGNTDGSTSEFDIMPLVHAAAEESLEQVELELARLPRTLQAKDILLDYSEHNLMHAAALNKEHPDVLLLLHQLEVDINAQDRYGRTPLHQAIDANNVDAAKILLDFGADISILNEAGSSPVEYCNGVLQYHYPDHQTCLVVVETATDLRQ